MTAQPKVSELEAGQPIVGEKIVNLALQGGGSHGAFTWGVLDRLLEDDRIGFDGVTATSAGGVNAVVLADGFSCRTQLEQLAQVRGIHLAQLLADRAT